MADKKNIYETISAVMDEIGAIGKNKRNEQQGFMYRGVDDVMNALNPAFIKHKLFMVPEVIEQSRERRTTGKGGELIYSVCKVRYTFFAEDGSSVQAVVIGEGMDSGDKASNKAMAVAFKYACFQVFCIPTEEMTKADAAPVDPDGASYEPSRPEPASEAMKRTFVKECDRIGKSKGSILKAIGCPSMEAMTVDHFKTAMEGFKRTPDAGKKELDPAMIPPDDTCGLPFK